MLEGHWTLELGWEPVYVQAFQNFTLNPGARTLLVGQQVNERIQAIMGFDNRIRLFRPELYLKKFRKAALRLALPDINEDELLICVKRLTLTDASYLPPAYTNGTLEIHLVMMSPEPELKFTKRNREAILYAFIMRHSYQSISEEAQPKVLYADSKFTRTNDKTLRPHRTPANFGNSFFVNDIAYSVGCNDVLWLHGKDEMLTDLNDANVFVYIINDFNKKELITPPANGLIIPGVTRQSVLEMCRYWVSICFRSRTTDRLTAPLIQRQFV